MKTTTTRQARKELREQFNNLDLIPVFEIEVINKETQEDDYILFNISIQKNTLTAQHVALTAKEDKSKKIAFKHFVLDPDFSLDENLQELYNICIEAIINSDYFTLKD